MSISIRIGTRDSRLAMWQAHQTRSLLEEKGADCSLVEVKSPADLDLNTPLHQFGGVGIFTKVLDEALLQGKVDIAVHSLKDYPTLCPDGIVIAAMLKRGSYRDILVHKGESGFLKDQESSPTIATGSIRRIAQWKNRYPNSEMTNLRGNVQTRLRKLEESDWQGAIFAMAGLERIDILPENHEVLDWMIPAPAQGVIAICCREEDVELRALLGELSDAETVLTSTVERDFLRAVEGGCSAPVGALAKLNGDQLELEAGLFEIDGSKKVVLKRHAHRQQSSELGKQTALEVLEAGGRTIMEGIKHG